MRARMVVAVAAFGGGFLWKISHTLNLLTAFGFGVIGTVWFALRGRELLLSDKQTA